MDIHWGGIIMWATLIGMAVAFGGGIFALFWSNWHTKTGTVFGITVALLILSIGLDYDGYGKPKYQPSPAPLEKVECVNV